jgi:hypothetical protein
MARKTASKPSFVNFAQFAELEVISSFVDIASTFLYIISNDKISNGKLLKLL